MLIHFTYIYSFLVSFVLFYTITLYFSYIVSIQLCALKPFYFSNA